jgi:beta-galactosidase
MIFGVDYYPEQWTPKDWDEDIAIMQNLGISLVRLAEFSWAIFEPKENKFEFSFYDQILEKFYKANFKVILGTPTATFPPWLYKKHPDIVQVTQGGIVRTIGTRRQASFHSKNYLKACEKIVYKLAKHYGTHPAVVGWQIDNEPGHEGSDLDYSQNALIEFRNWLKNKYKTIENLNQSWGNVFWGVLYTNFDEIPLPTKVIASNFNPSMIQDFYRFNSDALINFIEMQIKILRENTKNQFITTNLFPSPFLAITDMKKLSKNLDFVSWDNYPVWGSMTEPYPHQFIAGTHEYIRGLKEKNFTVMEQISGFQGHDLLGYLPAPGQISTWLIQAIAHGAESVVFFRYRTARFGQEQLCYGILDHDKSITDRYLELQKTISVINQYADDFVYEASSASVACLHDIENRRNLKHQPISEGLKIEPNEFASVGYDLEFFTQYAGMNVLNVPTHILPTSSDSLENYKILILPMYFMIDINLVLQLEKYISQGGVLILGYRAGIKDLNGWMLDEVPPGPFKNIAGVEVKKFDVLGKTYTQLKMGLFSLKAGKIAEIIEPKTAKVLARYKDSKKFYKNLPAITVNKYKKGKVYYVGTSLEPESLVLFYRHVLKEEKIPYAYYGRHVEKIFRKGKTKDYEILINHSGKTKLCGLNLLKPYSFKIIPKEKNGNT